jgi:molecular chaperone GrpE
MEKELDEAASEEASPEESVETEEVESLKQELEDLKDQLMEERAFSKNYLNSAKRIQADFDNYKKRQQREIERITETANEKLISELLLIIDDFERALAISDSEKGMEGVRQIHSNIKSLLKGYGLREAPADGHFNPDLHEALCVGEGEEGKILEVYQKGYFLGDKVIRYTKVMVGKQKEGE